VLWSKNIGCGLDEQIPGGCLPIAVLDLEIILVALAALFVGGFVKGAIGFGLPLVVTPILLFYLPLASVITLIIFPVLISNFQQCWLTRTSASILRVIWPMVSTNVLVLLLASHFIATIDGNVIRIIVGCLIVVHVILIEKPYFPRVSTTDSLVLSGLSGVISGAIGSISSFFSFPSVQILHSMRLQSEAFVFALGIFMASGFIALWTGMLIHGVAVLDNLGYSILAVAPVILGVWSGNQARKGISQKKFRLVVSGMLFLVGISLVIRGL